LLRCASRPRDACDRFLPSTASITSTRVSFVLDEVVASCSRTISVSAFTARPVFRRTEHSSTQRFHAAVVTVVDDRFSVSGFPAITEPLSCLSSLFDVPACESLRSGPHTEVAPSSLPDAIREDLAALQAGTNSIERYISSASVLRRLPRATGVDQCREPVRLSLVLPPTCRLTAPFRRCDTALRLQTRLPRLGPRTHPLV